LHEAFRLEYANHVNELERPIEVFSAGQRNEKWRISEFGFDILVVETDGFEPTPRHKRDMPVFGRPLWQVESEMGVDGFEVGKDLGKLVVGAAADKLLVTRCRNDVEGFNDYIAGVSRNIKGSLFVAYVPSYSRNDAGIAAWQATTPIPFELYEIWPKRERIDFAN
jgi:hypothetical protein